MKNIESLRKEYQVTVGKIRSILPDWKEMTATIQAKALQIESNRLSAQYRFYTPTGIPEPQDWIQAAKEALAFAEWFTENGLDQLPDSVCF